MTENIAATNQSFMTAFAAGDAKALAALYTTDGQLAPPNSDVVTGHEAIAGFWQGAMDVRLKGVTLETVELDEYGDTAVEQGRYQLTDGEGNVADRCKYW